MRYVNADGTPATNLGPVEVTEMAIWAHSSPIRVPSAEDRHHFVWGCTGEGCTWRHHHAADGGAAYFRHQAEMIAEALAAANLITRSPG